MATGRVSKVKGKVVDIPNPPTIGTATAGSLSVSIAFTADSSGKGGPTRSYIAKSNPGNITATGSTSPINVTGLTGDTSYTISVAGVNETGTSEYSSASNSATALNPGSFESIATVSVGSGGASNIEFTSIPSTFEHLQIRFIGRINRSGESSDFPTFRFNNDTASNYSWHALEGSGASAFAEATANASVPRNGEITATTAGASIFGAGVVDILDYRNTNKYKTVRNLVGHDQNGSGTLWFGSSSWRDTSAITSIKIETAYGTGFQQYTNFALYGIKGA